MQVYKAYFQIIKSHLLAMAIYFSIFVVITLIITQALSQTSPAAFAQAKSKIAFFSEEDSALDQGLQAYLRANAEIVPLPDDPSSIQDALFFDQVDTVVRVPQGFTTSFLQGRNDVRIQTTSAPSAAGSVYTDFLINKFLRTASLYRQNLPDLPESQIVANTDRDLQVQAQVKVNTADRKVDLNDLSYYFQYLAYSLLAIIIMGVTSFMMTFNDPDLSNRNLCSPLPPLKLNLQIVLGNATFGLVVWALLCALIFLFYGRLPLDTGTLLLIVNALVFTLDSLSIGFLAGKFVQSHGVQGAVTNVISLGIAFVSGIFVEQELLGSTVLTIASFTPGYWYVKAVADLRNMAVFNVQNILPVIYSILIQLAFSVAFLLIALLVTKQKRLSKT
jgi:ABC-2 type transport system permease protein